MSATVTYGLIGLAGSMVINPPVRHLAVVTVLGATLIVYFIDRRNVFGRLAIQSNRRTAERGPLGMVYFGALLGTGLLTEMSTPLVLAGLALSFIGGAGWGISYGLGFAFGRSRPAAAGVIAGYGRGPADIVERMVIRGVVRRRLTGIVVTAGVLGIYATGMVR